MKHHDDSICALVKHAANTRAEDIPDDVMQWTGVLLLDTVACILAGGTAEGIAAVRDGFLLWGGNPQATVLGFGDRTGAPTAAFINAAMGHARDYDDTHDGALHHGCVTIVPALLATAEVMQSNPVSGKDPFPRRAVSGREFIAALAVGLDVANRLGMAFIPHLHTGWLPTTLWGPFGCVAACGRLLGFDETAMANAFGLAYSTIHGNRQALIEGKLAKRMQPGFTAQAGVQAAFFAARGVTAAVNLIDGEFGIPALHSGGQCDRTRLTEGVGAVFETSNISIKPYPSCRCTHAVIDAALTLQREQSVTREEIARGTICLPPQAMGQIGRPFRIRDNPTVDAQFSAPYTAALAFMNGKVVLDDFAPETIRERRSIVHLAEKFCCVEFEKNEPGLVPVEMSVELNDGRRADVRVEHPKGGPGNPLTEQELSVKFNDCLDHAVQAYSREDRDKILACLRGVPASDPLSLLQEPRLFEHRATGEK